MSNYMQLFVGVFILNCIFTPSLSLPRAHIPDPEPSETCFEVEEPSGEISLTELAVDSEENQCNFGGPLDINPLFNQTHLKEAFADLKAKACPSWRASKNCVIDHLNSDKCSEEDVRIVKDAGTLNGRIVLRELLCNPSSTHSLLHLLSNTARNGIWECFFRTDVQEILLECIETLSIRTDDEPPSFHTISKFFGCLNPAIARCADGDIIKEITMLRAWNEVGSSWGSAYRNFWENV